MKTPILVAVSILFSGAALAAGHDHHDMGAMQSPAAVATTSKDAGYAATGVVKRIDAANGKVTVQHEAIASLGWPRMTMAFRVADKKTLASLKPEQKVDFRFVQKGNEYVITSVQ